MLIVSICHFATCIHTGNCNFYHADSTTKSGEKDRYDKKESNENLAITFDFLTSDSSLLSMMCSSPTGRMMK